MNTDQNRTIELDVRGLTCPEPVLRARQALDSLARGTVSVRTDDAACRDNIVRFAKSAGHEVESSESGDGTCVVSITKSGLDAARPQDAGTVIFVSSDQIGRGADELGQLLMGLFLRTLSEMPAPPARLILANAGVKLAVEGSPALDALGKLEHRGVKIGVCGTCLDFYGIKEKIRVGTVSNLYEVTEQLLAAAKVISL
jgi:selenium metabolism protein YedF